MDWLWRRKGELDLGNRVRVHNVTAEYVALDVVGPLADAVPRAVSSTPMQRDLFRLCSLTFMHHCFLLGLRVSLNLLFRFICRGSSI